MQFFSTLRASPTSEASGGAAESARESIAQIDRSCCWPGLILLNGALGWLAIAAVFGFISSLKIHAPYLLADSAWMTYGRIQALAANLLVYGFGIQAGIALLLWLLARTSETSLVQPGLAAVAALFWNVGVAVGGLGIWAGDAAGYAWFDMPRYAVPILFASYLGLAALALATFAGRRVAELHPAVWFALAAIFWFPWIYSTASLLLLFYPVRGALQAVVHGWFVGNLIWVWFGCVGLAALFYMLPGISGRPLYSRYLAMFTFWCLLVFGSLTGITAGGPLPGWIGTLSSAATVGCLPAVLAVLLNLQGTLNRAELRGKPLLLLAAAAAGSYGIAGFLASIGAIRGLATHTQLTWFSQGVSQLVLLGFLGSIIFVFVYALAPAWCDKPFPSALLAKAHAWCFLPGVALQAAAFIGAGLIHGSTMGDLNLTFLQAHRAALIPFRLSTLGDLLILMGSIALVANLKLLLWSVLCDQFRSFCLTSQAARPKPLEARS